MSRNTIPWGRWLAIAADTRLVGRWQVLGLTLLCVVLLFPDSAVAGKPAPPSGWKAVALNTDSNIQSNAFDINDAGDVVGELRLTSSSGRFAVLWEVTGTTVKQYTLADGTRASGVNEWQEVVGESGADAVYWESVSSPAVVLPTVVEGQVSANVSELNDDGVIVGWVRVGDANSSLYPVVWRVVDGVPTMGYQLPGGTGQARDLTNNDADGVATIVGSARFGDHHRPVTWQVWSNPDGSLELVSGPDDVDPLAVGYGDAMGINALGDVCGQFRFAHSPDEGWSAVRARSGGSLEILEQINEQLPADQNKAISINNAGKAVGYDWYPDPKGSLYVNTGILWEVDGSAKQLSKLVSGWKSILFAYGINNQGVIAASGQLKGGGPLRALIMIPPQ